MQKPIKRFLISGIRVLCTFALGGLLILLCFATLSGCLSYQLTVGQKEFASIEESEPLDLVKDRLGYGMRHCFTVSRMGHEWRMFRCHVRRDNNYSPVIDLLFRDGKFCKYVDLLDDCKDGTLTDSCNGSGGTIRGSHPLDYTHVDRALSLWYSHQSVLERLKPRNDSDTSYALVPVLVMMLPLLPVIMWQGFEYDFRHLMAIRELDGNRFGVGDPIDRAFEEIGAPMRKKVFDDGTECLTWFRPYLYPGSTHLPIDRRSLILAIIVVNGRIEAVYSRDTEPGYGWYAIPSWWEKDAE